MANNVIVRIMTSLLKHQMKKVVGDETLNIIAQEAVALGSNKVDQQIKSWLGAETNAEQLEKAATSASESFRGKINDAEIEQWIMMLPIDDLPNVLEAIDILPSSPDESKLENAMRESIALNWKRLSPEQVDNAVNSFLSCLRSALLPIEKQTLMVIGRSVLRTEGKVDLLLRWFEQHIITGKFVPPSVFNLERILDLESYMWEIDRLYLEANIEKYYVPLEGWLETENGQKTQISLDDYVRNWLDGISGHLAILGDYGAGKSWFCLKVSKYLVDRYRLDPNNNPLPLLITFKRYKRNMDLAELIKQELTESYGVNINNTFQLRALLRSGKVLPILDGMDEMAKEIGTHTALVRFSKLGMAREIPKAIISCRTNYFRSGNEEGEFLGADERKQLLKDFLHFNVIFIHPFDQSKVIDSIIRRFERKKALDILSFVHNTYNLTELCTRPVLLSMVCESYEMLPKINYTLSSSDLYDVYIDAWLERELQRGRITVDPKTVKMIFEDLAEDMVKKDTLIIKADVLKTKFESALKLERFPDEDWQAVERQLTTSTFIKRFGINDWQFAHRSFQEYFYACKFYRWENETGGKGIFSVLSTPIWQFISQMVVSKWSAEKAKYWIQPRIKIEQDRTLTETTLRAAAAYWLIKTESRQLHTYPLSGIMLDAVDLSNLDLSSCNLAESDFHDSNFGKTKLVDTNLERSNLNGSDFQYADLRKTNMKFCSISEADFRNANFGDPHSDTWLRAIDCLKTCIGRALFDDEIYKYLGI